MKTIAYLLPLFLLGACASDNTNSQPQAQPNALSANNDSEPAGPICRLAGLYASSEASGNSVQNLFDANPDNAWKTRTGAGPDEGIMLYFEDGNEPDIERIELTPVKGSFNADKSVVQVYVNGHVNTGGPVDKPIQLEKLQKDEKIHSLYIRFVETGTEIKSVSKQDMAELTRTVFPSDASIGLTGLTLYDSDNELLNLSAPEKRTGSVVASTTLSPQNAYDASHLFDFRKEFAWVEGNKDSAGKGEWLRFSFDEPVNITAIRIWNGYQRSEQHRTANARIKAFRFGARDESSQTFQLKDTAGSQHFEIAKPIAKKQFELYIEDVYAGHSYKDLAISDLVFYDGEQAFILESIAPQRQRRSLMGAAQSSPLDRILDRRIYNEIVDENSFIYQSIILRSDGTFVMYRQLMFDEGASNSNVVADGNWELLDSNSETARVKVFGKYHDLSQIMAYYQGTEEMEITKIFNDEVTITKQGVLNGQRYIERFDFE